MGEAADEMRPEGAPPADRRRRAGMAVGVACIVLGLVLGVVALVTRSDGGATNATTISAAPVVPDDLADGTTAPTTDGGLGVGTVPERDGRSPLRGFGEVEAIITSGTGKVCRVCLLAARTTEQRARGLMQVTDEDLGGYDGMVFEYPAPVGGAFWMRNTPMPLSIAYFDEDGALVSTTDMEPCSDSSSCPTYPADAPFTYAVEVPQGKLDEVGISGEATLRIVARTCPLAGSGS